MEEEETEASERREGGQGEEGRKIGRSIHSLSNSFPIVEVTILRLGEGRVRIVIAHQSVPRKPQ